ncbi:MAG: UvrB/UvrC motif-containing protein [Planctomycetota bacterium]
MPRRPPHLDALLNDWPYEFGEVNARRAFGADGRSVLQMRVDLGVLQLEVSGRPDGARPEGFESLADWIRQRDAEADGSPWRLDADECAEVDREFVQYYHRRVAWLALREFLNATKDADHTLALMDLCAQHAPNDEWVELHERYRPFVLFHRTQAAALACLEEGEPRQAIDALDAGLEQIADAILGDSFDGALPAAADPYTVGEESADRFLADADFADKLRTLRQSIVAEYGLQPTLEDQLSEAIANEQYERAAQIRDRISEQRDR